MTRKKSLAGSSPAPAQTSKPALPAPRKLIDLSKAPSSMEMMAAKWAEPKG